MPDYWLHEQKHGLESKVKRISFFINWFKHRRTSAGLILLYHRVADLNSDPWQLCVSPRNFEQQMQLLRERCSPVSLRELAPLLDAKQSPRSPVVVTFDDGYADNLHQALPTLEQFEIPATFFLTTGWLSRQREFWWDELDRLLLQPGSLPETLRLTADGKSEQWFLREEANYTAEDAEKNRWWGNREEPPTVRYETYYAVWKRLYTLSPQNRQSVLDEILEWAGAKAVERRSHRRLSREEIDALSQSSLVEIGAHTVNHPVLTALSPAAQKREIELNKISLEELIDRPVNSIAYPHGDYSEETIGLVQQAGFSRACTTRPGPVWPHHDPFKLPRLYIGNWDGDELARRIYAWQNSPP
jgi:peptidoglycan/xylan/chitin deacetylase (PgdA/CDA1 family)